MRLARLAAMGLAIGVIAGFAVALLRPRPSTSSVRGAGTSGDRSWVGPVRDDQVDDQIWDQFRRADERTSDSSVAGLGSTRRVNG